MKGRVEIIFSGVGGQGLVSMGDILCRAAIEYEGRYAALSTEYGIETRGSFAKSDVILSDKPIGYPEIERPGIVLALAQAAYDHYASMGIMGPVIYDSGEIHIAPGVSGTQIGLPFQQAARENLVTANMLALGFVAAYTRAVRRQSILQTLQDAYGRGPAGKRNRAAYEIGVRMFQENKWKE